MTNQATQTKTLTVLPLAGQAPSQALSTIHAYQIEDHSTQKERRVSTAVAKRKTKLSMLERGKIYHDLNRLDGMTQMEIAKALEVTQTEVSNSISLYNMPFRLKSLIHEGILSENEMFLAYRDQIRVKGDREETERKADIFADLAIKHSQDQVASGGQKKVRLNGKPYKSKQKAKLTATDRVSIDDAFAVIKALVSDTDESAEQTAIAINQEQLATLKKAVAVFQ